MKQIPEVQLFSRDADMDSGFVKMMFGVEKKLGNDRLSGCEVAVFIYLAMNLDYTMNIATHRNGKPIKRTHIAEDLGYNKLSVYKAVTTLTDLGYLQGAKVGNYNFIVVNPRYARKSNNIDPQIYELFDRKQNT